MELITNKNYIVAISCLGGDDLWSSQPETPSKVMKMSKLQQLTAFNKQIYLGGANAINWVPPEGGSLCFADQVLHLLDIRQWLGKGNSAKCDKCTISKLSPKFSLTQLQRMQHKGNSTMKRCSKTYFTKSSVRLCVIWWRTLRPPRGARQPQCALHSVCSVWYICCSTVWNSFKIYKTYLHLAD